MSKKYEGQRLEYHFKLAGIIIFIKTINYDKYLQKVFFIFIKLL